MCSKPLDKSSKIVEFVHSDHPDTLPVFTFAINQCQGNTLRVLVVVLPFLEKLELPYCGTLPYVTFLGVRKVTTWTQDGVSVGQATM
jgi:hypothetical protein